MPLIHCLLPSKEYYTRENAGAVAMVMEDMVLASQYNEWCHVFGRTSQNKPLTQPFTPLIPKTAWFYGQNIGMARAYLDHLSKMSITPDWVEVHGRCQVAAYLAQKRPDLNIVLVLPNDSRGMKGAKTPSERKALAKSLVGVFALSQYLIDGFNDGLDEKNIKGLIQQVTPLGIDRRHQKIPKKKKQIVITGRMVPEKGILEAAYALAMVLPKYPDWSARLIGAKGFKESDKTPYERAVVKALAPCGDQAQTLGFMPVEDVYQEQDQASIALVPSQWEEPAGRVLLEAMVAGAALITTRRGGIPEYAEGRAIILDDPNPDAIAHALQQLICDPKMLKTYQQKAWDNYTFTRAHAGQKVDLGRDAVKSYCVKDASS